MNSQKQQYLIAVRANSAYPAYRGVIGTVALLGYLLAGAFALAALIAGFTTMTQSFMLGVVVLAGGAISAALVFLMARFYKEAALILADIGDVVTEAGASGQALPAMGAPSHMAANRAPFDWLTVYLQIVSCPSEESCNFFGRMSIT